MSENEFPNTLPDPSRDSGDPAADGIGSEAPTTPGGPARAVHTHEHPTEVGPYSIREVLGEGGMGAVYLAWQSEPVQREVALKLIKLGMDTREVVARFDAERQTLAVMSHPSIAQVYDAGATESGRPYFVMEHVSGVTIDKHCDRHELSIEERLALFQQVCDGIQHAHQKGVVHRDLKPSNVLVTIQGSAAIPKIIDFGIAKATGPDTKLGVTEQGVVIGTPEYMSPEQASGAVDQIDTRSDIYSLGILLYELVVGVVPFDAKMLRGLPPLELREFIMNKEPPRPSARFAGLEEPKRLAGRRGTDPAVLTRVLRADLDWIILKALDKDPGRRYASASEFSADIQRFLDDETVEASPPTIGYRLNKFVRRNKVPVAAITAIVLTLCFALASSMRSYRSAEDARESESQARKRLETTLGEARRSLASLFLEKAGRALDDRDYGRAAVHAARAVAEEDSGEARTILHEAWTNAPRIAWQSQDTGTDYLASSDGRYLALLLEGKSRTKFVVYDRKTGTELFRRSAAPAPIVLGDEWIVQGGERLAGWRLPGGEQLAESPVRAAKTTGHPVWMALSPTGDRVVIRRSSGRTSVTQIHDKKRNSMVGSIRDVDNDVKSLSPCGRWIGSIRGESLEVHSLIDGTLAFTAPCEGATGIVRFSEKGQVVGAGTRGGKIHIFSHEGGALERSFDLEVPGRAEIQIHGDTVWAWNERKIVAWSLVSGDALYISNEDVPHEFRFDGDFGAWYPYDGDVKLVDLNTGDEHWRRPVHIGIEDLELVADKLYLVIAAPDVLEARQLLDGDVGLRFSMRRVVAFEPGEHDTVVMSQRDPGAALEVWHPPKPTERVTLQQPKPSIQDVVLMGASVCMATRAGLTIVSADEEQLLEGHDRPVYCLALSPDGRFVASGSSDRSVRVWDLEGGREMFTIDVSSNPVHAVAYSPDGKSLAVAHGIGVLSLRDAESGDELHRLEGHGAQVYSLDYSSDGHLVSVSQDGTYRIWNVASGQCLAEGSVSESGLTDVRFLEDGTSIAIADAKGWVEIIDRLSSEGIVRFKAHDSRISDLVIRGGQIYTSSLDGTVRIWDAASGEARGIAVEHSGPVTCIAVSVDGGRLLTSDGTHSWWTSLEAFRFPVEGIVDRVGEAVGR